MATSFHRRIDTVMVARTGALVGGCTAALTASFVGAVALLTGNAPGAAGRLQFYILAGAAGFVAALIVLEESKYEGQTILKGASLAGVGTALLVGFGAEGVRYALADPAAVVASSLFVYLLAAALIASGLGYWSLRNWRQVGRAFDDDHL